MKCAFGCLMAMTLVACGGGSPAPADPSAGAETDQSTMGAAGDERAMGSDEVPVERASEARAMFESAVKNCPGYITALGPQPEACAAGDGALEYEHWSDPATHPVLIDALGSDDPTARGFAAHIINFKAAESMKGDAAAAAAVLAAVEKETDPNMGMVVGNALGRFDLTKTGHADAVEKLLREKSAHGLVLIGVINTVMTQNGDRFRPVLEDLAADPDLGDAAKMHLE